MRNFVCLHILSLFCSLHPLTSLDQSIASLTMSIIPQAGASGGPIVEVETGAVIGIIRGSRSSYATPRERGFGTPAEKLYDVCLCTSSLNRAQC